MDMKEASILTAAPQVVTDDQIKTDHTTVSFHPQSNTLSLSTSQKHLVPIMKSVANNDYIPDCNTDDILFIDEDDSENEDVIRR